MAYFTHYGTPVWDRLIDTYECQKRDQSETYQTLEHLLESVVVCRFLDQLDAVYFRWMQRYCGCGFQTFLLIHPVLQLVK